jgi:hypothetical protein
VSPLRRSAGAVPAWISSGVGVQCNLCDGRFSNDDALESHQLAYHAGKRRRVLRIFYLSDLIGPRIKNPSEAMCLCATFHGSRCCSHRAGRRRHGEQGGGAHI